MNLDNGFLGDFDSPSVSRFSFQILHLIVIPLLNAWANGLRLKLRRLSPDGDFNPFVDDMVNFFATFLKLVKKWPWDEMAKVCLDAVGVCNDFPFNALRRLVGLLYFLFIEEGSTYQSNCPSFSNILRGLCEYVRAHPNFEHFVRNAEDNREILNFIDGVSAEPREEEMLTGASQVNPEKKGLKRKLFEY